MKDDLKDALMLLSEYCQANNCKNCDVVDYCDRPFSIWAPQLKDEEGGNE